MLRRTICALILLGLSSAGSLAQRKPVLRQIDLPHPYYYHEMYLPQLTSGPSSVAWSRDSREVVYSMAGSLWRQKIDSNVAQQLTDGSGYDYQPDWSPDGRTILYCSYQKDAIELWLLDLPTGKTQQLTSGSAVNVEPRWSPDGNRVAYVSTTYHGHFHIFVADVHDGKLANPTQLTGETKSTLSRYYYSAFDHEISPAWSPDGQDIVFVSNRGHIHGTGGIWRMKAQPGAEAREIHYEETNWKARPDFSPDGSRIIYSSYLGRSWHQLWVMTSNGGDVFPVSYGDWDETYVRWSPDGKQLAFISNKEGGTEVIIRDFEGGAEKKLLINDRKYLAPHVSIGVTVLDEKAKAQFARISITDGRGQFYAPAKAWIHADDGYERNQRAFEAHYFYAKTATLDVPEGELTIDVMKGFAHEVMHRVVNTKSANSDALTFKLKRLDWEDAERQTWVSADLHAHMNYGGTYRSEYPNLLQIAEGEDLNIVNNLVVNKEQRFPDIQSALFNKARETLSDSAIVVPGQEFHTSYWGHRGILGLTDHLLLPGYAGYPNTAAASLYPMNADVYEMAHAQGALVGAVHPFDEMPDPFAQPAQKITDELPIDVALGKLDYMEIVGFSDHKSTAAVWYKLLNLGFKLPAGAGTDATADYAAPIRGQVGFDRVYVWDSQRPMNVEDWMNSLKAGRTFVTNGPLIEFKLGGKMVGSELKFDAPQAEIAFTAKLRSIVPVDHLELVCNGNVTRDLKLQGTRDSADVTGTIPLNESGWCVLRAWSEKAEYPVLDNYVYATSSPIYVRVGGQPPRSPKDAAYFSAWIDSAIETTSNYPDWNSDAEKKSVLDRLRSAKAIYEKMR